MSDINGCKNKGYGVPCLASSCFDFPLQKCINIYKQADYLEISNAYFEVTKDDGVCQDLCPEDGPN